MSISEQYLLSSCEYLVLCPAEFCSLWMATAIIDSKSMKDKSFLPDKTAFGWITYSVSLLHLSCHILWSQPGNSADLNRRWAFSVSQWAKNSACFINRWICPSIRSSYGKKELILFIPLTDQTRCNRKIHSCACFCVVPSVMVTLVISVGAVDMQTVLVTVVYQWGAIDMHTVLVTVVTSVRGSWHTDSTGHTSDISEGQLTCTQSAFDVALNNITYFNIYKF